MNRRAFFGLFAAAAFAKPSIRNAVVPVPRQYGMSNIRNDEDWPYQMNRFYNMVIEIAERTDGTIGVTGLPYHPEDLMERLGIE